MLEFTVGVLGKTMNAEVMKTEEYDLEKRPLELAEHIGRTESMEDEDSDLRLPTPAKRRAVIKNPPVRSSAFSVQCSGEAGPSSAFSVQRSTFSVPAKPARRAFALPPAIVRKLRRRPQSQDERSRHEHRHGNFRRHRPAHRCQRQHEHQSHHSQQTHAGQFDCPQSFSKIQANDDVTMGASPS